MSHSTPVTHSVMPAPKKAKVTPTMAFNCALLAGPDATGPIVAASDGFLNHRIKAKLNVRKASDDDVQKSFLKLSFPFGQHGQNNNATNGKGLVFRYDSNDRCLAMADCHALNIAFPRGTIFAVEPVPEALANKILALQNDAAASNAFPRETTFAVEQAPEALANKIPALPNDGAAAGARRDEKPKSLLLVKIRLPPGANLFVEGFGLPFANGDDAELEAWVNHAGVLAEAPGVSLISILRQREVCLVLASNVTNLQDRLNPVSSVESFSYPYGTEHDWDLERAGKLIEQHKSHKQYNPVYRFQDDNSHICAITQCVVQDVYWIIQDAKRISTEYHEAYFVPSAPGSANWFVVVMLDKDFRTVKFSAAWPTLADCEDIHLSLKVNGETSGTVDWKCSLMEHPESRPALQAHAIEKHWAVFSVVPNAKDAEKFAMKVHTSALDVKKDIGSGRLNLAAIDFRLDTRDEQRKVEAACKLLPGALPTNLGLTHGHFPGASLDPSLRDVRLTTAEIEDRMDLCRSFWRCAGFWSWMNKPRRDLTGAMEQLSLGDANLRPLEVVNYLAGVDDRLRDALLGQALPKDREPLGKYLSARPLGVAMVTGGPGFGKTTVLAIMGIAMRRTFGHLLCSGPSNAAVSNLALRLDLVGTEVCKEYNAGKAEDDGTRLRRWLVVRAFRSDQNLELIQRILGNPENWMDMLLKSKWTLHLTPVFWLFVVMGSRFTKERTLQSDDCQFLHDLHEKVMIWPELAPVRQIATASTTKTWHNLSEDAKHRLRKVLKVLLLEIAQNADILCMTPAVSSKDEDSNGYLKWKQETARCVLVDEAGNMNRPDIFCVAGNVLLPLAMGGDPKQLRPLVKSKNQKDAEGKFQNRFAKHGQISGMEIVASSGFPVYQLTKQLPIP
ncbi:hypothetical protein QBC41DRAFT_300529 [Cercophora samala]|uniref:DNA2/NAM7 helicase helicase domain-containing protein n=1 Tax=Cercophora samala TaxID=330535 RepID=A0AA39ZIZ4_9PEZI|nr:hypothetical protein QBC41DRAFT_300529 [Cercophora samala]